MTLRARIRVESTKEGKYYLPIKPRKINWFGEKSGSTAGYASVRAKDPLT